MERHTRLRQSADFERVRREGRSWPHPLLVLAACANGLDYTRVGIAASRSVGQAVARNRARRLLRETTRQLYHGLSPGWDVVLIARPGILEVKQPQVQEVVLALARRAGLMAQERGQ